MKKVFQTDQRDDTGDCVRACIASIFERDIETVPNFWLETQNSVDFWSYLNNWSKSELGCSSILMKLFKDSHKDFIDGLLCVAIGESSQGFEHAVVWKDGMIHNPSKNGGELSQEPKLFLIFCPTNIYKNTMKQGTP
jgi:hypothetical protein